MLMLEYDCVGALAVSDCTNWLNSEGDEAIGSTPGCLMNNLESTTMQHRKIHFPTICPSEQTPTWQKARDRKVGKERRSI